MKTIWKFELKMSSSERVQMPKGAEILCVQTQYGKPCLWALVNPEEKEKVFRIIETCGTGHDIHELRFDFRKYIGTYQLHDGKLVFHVFEYTAQL